MRLFIAEKKVLAEAIASALPGSGKTQDGVIRKGDNVVVWCSGHLLTLKEPEAYDSKYKEWDLSHLPIYFENWKNAVPDENKKRVNQIGDLIKEADEIVNCGDIDEEGQLLVDEVLRWFKYTGPCKRLDTANTTVDALKKALGHMKNNKDCEPDGWSAYARQVSDMTFGINFTRYFSKACNARLPVGRVMTPTLGLVVNRDKIIEGHKKTYYYNLNLDVNVSGKTLNLKYVPQKDFEELQDGKFLNDTFLKEYLNVLKGSTSKYTVKKEKVTENPPLPFNLTALNNYCGKKWGYNPDKVMKITQTLRDDYACITYNRSDCQYLSMEHHKEAPDTIASVCKNFGISQNDYDTSKVSRCFNDANITAHFAIIPTNAVFDIKKLSAEQLNVYKVITNFYLAQFMPPCIKEKSVMVTDALHKGSIIGKIEGSSTIIVSPGYRALLSDVSSDDESEEGAGNDISSFGEGSYDGKCIDGKVVEKETKPPARYTQTSLYDDMTKISKYVDDPEVKKLLLEKDKEKKGENGSIGTSATRAEIIKKLIAIGYLEEKKEGKRNVLISTDKGRTFYAVLPDSIKKADTTARWWVVQEDIKTGKATYKDLTEKVVALIKEVMATFKPENVNTGAFAMKAQVICSCPNCGKDISKGKFGMFCTGKCGFKPPKQAYGKPLTEKQIISLCGGKRVKLTGLKKKNKDETYDAYVVPDGVEDFSYDYNGKHYEGKQLKFKQEYK